MQSREVEGIKKTGSRVFKRGCAISLAVVVHVLPFGGVQRDKKRANYQKTDYVGLGNMTTTRKLMKLTMGKCQGLFLDDFELFSIKRRNAALEAGAPTYAIIS